MSETLVMLDHLSGYHVGTRDTMMTDEVKIGSSADVDIHFPASKVPGIEPLHARLWNSGDGYHIESIGDAALYVNDRQVTSQHLNPNDLIQLGAEGPLLRFRLYAEVERPYKSVTEAVSDCIDCAKKSSDNPVGQTMAFFRQMPSQTNQISPFARTMVLGAVLLLIGATTVLAWQTTELRQSLSEQAAQLDDISMIWGDAESIDEFWEKQSEATIDEEAIAAIKDSLVNQLSVAQARIDALEARTDAGQRTIASASEAVVFLQGGYGFVDRDGEPLRIQMDPDGAPLLDANGNPQILLGGEGPPVEIFYTGTGFIEADHRLIMTNRHVALPWEYDETAQAMMERFLKPVMLRFIAYLPGIQEPFNVELVKASDNADVATLQFMGEAPEVQGLAFSAQSPEPGDEVIVMGYPTGVRALLARTNDVFVSNLLQETHMDFWTTAEQLSENGFITPLSTRGIIGQVTSSRIVYDAGTTHGGSGGPVLGLDGQVYAVNAAILRDFEGSNLGVPAAEAKKLLP